MKLLLVGSMFLFLLAAPVKAQPDINNLEITYERAFNHNPYGVTVMMEIKNNTGYDVKITENQNLKSNVIGFKLYHENSYSVNGGTLKDGELKKNETLLYFHESSISDELEWVTPVFTVMMDGKEYTVEGEKMIVE